MFKITKNTIAKNPKGYIVFIVVMNFHKNFSITKIFPSRFPGIFANIFKHKIIPVYCISWSRYPIATATGAEIRTDVWLCYSYTPARSLVLVKPDRQLKTVLCKGGLTLEQLVVDNDDVIISEIIHNILWMISAAAYCNKLINSTPPALVNPDLYVKEVDFTALVGDCLYLWNFHLKFISMTIAL